MLWIVLGSGLLVLLIFLEGRRQARHYGPPSGTGSSGIGSAMLELQKTLEPERKVEILLVEEDETEAAESGEPIVPGGEGGLDGDGGSDEPDLRDQGDSEAS